MVKIDEEFFEAVTAIGVAFRGARRQGRPRARVAVKPLASHDIWWYDERMINARLLLAAATTTAAIAATMGLSACASEQAADPPAASDSAVATSAATSASTAATAPASEAATDSPSDLGSTPKSHTNNVTFDPREDFSGTVHTVTFDWSKQYSVTDQQPWNGVTSSGNLTVTVDAGRNRSDPPAAWFNTQLAGGTAQQTGIASSGNPKQLNFAFTGVMTIDGMPYNVVMGQGSDGAGYNNWWLGGAGFAICSPADGYLCTPDRKWAFSDEGGSGWHVRSYPVQS